MKKIIIVLLITVLVAGFAFAGTLKGSAGISFSVDLNDKESESHAWGFKNTTSGKYTFKYEFDSTKVAIGEDHQTDVWAEIAAEANLVLNLSNKALGSADVSPKYTAKITKANIHVGDITFGILNAGSAINLAASYIDDNGDGDPDFDVVGGTAFLANGFTVSYKDWNGGFGAEGNWHDEDNPDDNVYKIFAHVETPTFTFADDQVSVLGGAYAFATDKETTKASQFGASVMAAYAADKLSVDAEADVAFLSKALVGGDKGKFAFEVALNATYDFVTASVYLAPGAFFGYADEDPLKLDAKVYAAYTFDLSDDIALAVDGYVDVRDTLVEDLVLYVGSSQSTAYDAFTFALSEDVEIGNLASDADVAVGLEASEKVTYKHDKFTAYEKLTATFDFSAEKALKGLAFEAGISSTEIVEGATLALVYSDVDFADFIANRGLITASCTITF